MQTKALKAAVLALTINCSAAYARSSAGAEGGWLEMSYPGWAAAASQIPAAREPEPVVADPGPGGQDAAAQLGPELALQKPPAPDAAQQIEEDLRGLGLNYDEATALRLARNARNHSIGAFTGWCYSYVADAMEMTGIIRRSQWYSLGIGVNAAADFAYWANRNPGTLRGALGLAKIDTPARAADLPMGAIVVYNRGTCGFSSRSGHIEVKVAPNLLCSDGCQPAYQACFGSPGVRAGISVYVPVKKIVKDEARVCRLTGSGDGKCFYKCADGSEHETWMKRPDPFNGGFAGGPTEACKQAVLLY